MIDLDKKTITITADNGDQKEFDILFAFKKDGSDKEYVVFTDYSPSEHGGTSLSAASYDVNDKDMVLSPIEEDEWDLVYGILENMQEELEKE